MKRAIVRRAAVLSIGFSLAVAASDTAFAGPYADEMAKCLVRATSDADKAFLVKWMFAAVAVHPAVKSIASISDAQRAEINKYTAKLLERLITESCKSETQEALKYEGPRTFHASFEVLGQVAARGLFTDPGVAKSMADLDNHIDKQKFEKLFGPLQ